jgi:hypothetical protein
VPLHSHAHALDAARAACCGEAQGKADEMAEALFRAEDLTHQRGASSSPSVSDSTWVRFGRV